jgi:hypothetical protein
MSAISGASDAGRVRHYLYFSTIQPTGTAKEFEKLAAEYNQLNINDEVERVAERHRLANRLGE